MARLRQGIWLPIGRQVIFFTITVRRKLHDDLRDQGETCSETRVARLTGLAGIAAQIGYKRRPERYGGKPAVVALNALDRQFKVGAPDTVCLSAIEGDRLSVTGDRQHLHQDARGLAVSCGRHRPVFTAGGRTVDAVTNDHRSRLYKPC